MKVGGALRKQNYMIEPYPTEPLVSEEAFENFITFARPNKTHFLTNGTSKLAKVPTEKLMERLVSSGMNFVRVSLHGTTANSHELITNTPGSFEDALSTVEKIGKCVEQHDLKYTLFLVVHKENIDEILDYMKIAEKNNVQHIYTLKLIPPYFGNVPNNILMDRQYTWDALLMLNEMRRKYHNKLFIELGVSWGVNFYTPGIYRFVAGQPKRPEMEAVHKTIKSIHQPSVPYCIAMAPRIAVHPEKEEIYPCMAMSGFPELMVGTLKGENLEIAFNERGKEWLRWHEDWQDKAKGTCAVDDCKFSDLCHGGCRITAMAPKLEKGGTPDWFAEFPDCITRLLEEMS